jgi:hypothetical protein
MLHRFTRTTVALALAGALFSAGCDDDEGGVTNPTPVPDVAGQYSVSWTLQVLRKSDGFQKQFSCYGTMTLTQTPGSGSTPLGGFASVIGGCAPESYDLTGSLTSAGAIEFTTDGPKPPEGPCPGGKNVRFSGQLTTESGYRFISARGVTTVSCPEYGEHEYSYLINASR